MYTFKNNFVWGLFCLALLGACSKNDDNTPSGLYSRGVIILNEGAFGLGNGEVSFYYRDSNRVVNNVFGKENGGRPLGDVIQSMTIHNNKGYIVANNSNKILVVDPNTFVQTAEIALRQPRYMVARGNIGYVSEWVDNDFLNPLKGQIMIIDLNTNTKLDSVGTDGIFPDELLLVNDYLYVVNSNDNTLSIINVRTRQLEGKVEAGNSLAGIVVDKNNKIWVLAAGEADFSAFPEVTTIKAGKLLQFAISGNTLTLEQSFDFPEFGGSNLIVNPAKDKLYYSFNGKVYEQEITASSLNTSPFISRGFYGIGIDPQENIFYGGVAPNFTNNGRVVRFNMQTRQALDSVIVGIGPNGFVFR